MYKSQNIASLKVSSHNVCVYKTSTFKNRCSCNIVVFCCVTFWRNYFFPSVCNMQMCTSHAPFLHVFLFLCMYCALLASVLPLSFLTFLLRFSIFPFFMFLFHVPFPHFSHFPDQVISAGIPPTCGGDFFQHPYYHEVHGFQDVLEISDEGV